MGKYLQNMVLKFNDSTWNINKHCIGILKYIKFTKFKICGHNLRIGYR